MSGQGMEVGRDLDEGVRKSISEEMISQQETQMK